MRMIYITGLLRKANMELFFWIAALLLLAFLNPYSEQVSLCPLKFLGFHYCPGCGLGRSIALLFRGRIAESFNMHPFGFFAVAIIGYRIVQLTNKLLKSIKDDLVRSEEFPKRIS
jgi:hypothetical protein